MGSRKLYDSKSLEHANVTLTATFQPDGYLSTGLVNSKGFASIAGDGYGYGGYVLTLNDKWARVLHANASFIPSVDTSGLFGASVTAVDLPNKTITVRVWQNTLGNSVSEAAVGDKVQVLLIVSNSDF